MCYVDYRPTGGASTTLNMVSSIGALVLGASVKPAEAHIRRAPASACALRNHRPYLSAHEIGVQTPEPPNRADAAVASTAAQPRGPVRRSVVPPAAGVTVFGTGLGMVADAVFLTSCPPAQKGMGTSFDVLPAVVG